MCVLRGPSEARTPQMHFLCSDDDDRLPSDLYNICKIVREIAPATLHESTRVVRVHKYCAPSDEVSRLRRKTRLLASNEVN